MFGDLVDSFADAVGEGDSFFGEDGLEIDSTESGADLFIDDGGEGLLEVTFGDGDSDELSWIDDTVSDEDVDSESALVGEDDGLDWGVEVEDSAFEVSDILNEGKFEVDAWFLDDSFECAELEYDGLFGLMDGEEG